MVRDSFRSEMNKESYACEKNVFDTFLKRLFVFPHRTHRSALRCFSRHLIKSLAHFISFDVAREIS
jgi:hypothetical protein